MDKWQLFYYCEYMLSGVKIYTNDNVWRQILTDLNAHVVDAPDNVALNFDQIELNLPVSAMELKSAILDAADVHKMITQILGRNVALSLLQSHIVILLHKSGGMSIGELKSALGFSPTTATHAVDTAIYQLRRILGHDFIENVNGVYKIGNI